MHYVWIDATSVQFSNWLYRIDENQQFVQLELLIANPASADFTIDILSIDYSATSKLLARCIAVLLADMM